jgi:hypothetical protein
MGKPSISDFATAFIAGSKLIARIMNPIPRTRLGVGVRLMGRLRHAGGAAG